MTPDQKMFVLHFVKQLHRCIEKRGAANQSVNGVGSISDDKGSYSCRVKNNNELLQSKVGHSDVKDC